MNNEKEPRLITPPNNWRDWRSLTGTTSHKQRHNKTRAITWSKQKNHSYSAINTNWRNQESRGPRINLWSSNGRKSRRTTNSYTRMLANKNDNQFLHADACKPKRAIYKKNSLATSSQEKKRMLEKLQS